MEMMDKYIETLKQGGKQTHLNMTLLPLLSADGGNPDYLILEEALAEGAVEIKEVSEGGSVPDLKLVNKGPQKVLVVDGEELVGAKQNRIVNATFLIAGNAEMAIPVSCVEQGRWSYRSHRFASGEKVMPASLRLVHQREVAINLQEGVGYRSNQGMIWDELAAKSERMGVRSPTGAMADLFQEQKDRLGEYLKAFHLIDCQTGALFAIHGQVVGLECFGHQKTFAKFFAKLVQSYAMDALDWLEEPKETRVPGESMKGFLEGVRNSPGKFYPSLGLGESLRFQNTAVAGAALVHEEKILHLSAFACEEEHPGGNKVSFQRFSRRRR